MQASFCKLLNGFTKKLDIGNQNNIEIKEKLKAERDENFEKIRNISESNVKK